MIWRCASFHGNATCSLLHAYIDMLRLRVDAASGAAAPFVAGHIRDLIGAVTAVAADDVILEQPGVKAGRLRAIKADIAAQVCDPRLDIAGVAARAGKIGRASGREGVCPYG